MARSLFRLLHRRFGSKLSGADLQKRSLAKREQFERWFRNASLADCSKILPRGVAAVGAGFSGLSAAFTLAQGGAKATVFEARERVGGRVETDRKLAPGRLIEAGAELIGLNHPMWISLSLQFRIGHVFLTSEDRTRGSTEPPSSGTPVTDRSSGHEDRAPANQRRREKNSECARAVDGVRRHEVRWKVGGRPDCRARQGDPGSRSASPPRRRPRTAVRQRPGPAGEGAKLSRPAGPRLGREARRRGQRSRRLLDHDRRLPLRRGQRSSRRDDAGERALQSQDAVAGAEDRDRRDERAREDHLARCRVGKAAVTGVRLRDPATPPSGERSPSRRRRFPPA